MIFTSPEYLQKVVLAYTSDLSVVEYLAQPDERLQWQANKLTADEIAEENATIIMHYNRYPLVVDPSGQATEFLMTQFADKKITKTSFLSDSFLKDLEAALRFGTALLVEDVESIDPVLNPVLNRGTILHLLESTTSHDSYFQKFARPVVAF